jgi:hypothetical protein
MNIEQGISNIEVLTKYDTVFSPQTMVFFSLDIRNSLFEIRYLFFSLLLFRLWCPTLATDH